MGPRPAGAATAPALARRLQLAAAARSAPRQARRLTQPRLQRGRVAPRPPWSAAAVSRTEFAGQAAVLLLSPQAGCCAAADEGRGLCIELCVLPATHLPTTPTPPPPCCRPYPAGRGSKKPGDGAQPQKAYEFAVDVAAGPPDSMFRCGRLPVALCARWPCTLAPPAPSCPHAAACLGRCQPGTAPPTCPPALRRHTKVLTLKPKYLIENQTGMPMAMKQVGGWVGERHRGRPGWVAVRLPSAAAQAQRSPATLPARSRSQPTATHATPRHPQRRSTTPLTLTWTRPTPAALRACWRRARARRCTGTMLTRRASWWCAPCPPARRATGTGAVRGGRGGTAAGAAGAGGDGLRGGRAGGEVVSAAASLLQHLDLCLACACSPPHRLPAPIHPQPQAPSPFRRQSGTSGCASATRASTACASTFQSTSPWARTVRARTWGAVHCRQRAVAAGGSRPQAALWQRLTAL